MQPLPPNPSTKPLTIHVVGDFSPDLDEGFKNTGFYLTNALAASHKVTRLNVKNIKSVDFWQPLRGLSPDVIHIISQPTLASYGFVKLLKLRYPRTPIFLSALRPERFFKGLSGAGASFLKWAKPSLTFTQDQSALQHFQDLGCKVAHLPNGVDTHKFHPATPEARSDLKRKYSLDPEKPVVLHVGHLEPDRNLLALKDLPGAGIQVVVAGSLYMGVHHELISQLEALGYHLFKGYQANVAELYQLADCYVFTPKPGNSLSMPLSVLEAMACNLPVVTTRFAGLSEAFSEGEGLYFTEPEGSFLNKIQQALQTKDIATRDKVSTYSWTGIAQRLEGHYREYL